MNSPQLYRKFNEAQRCDSERIIKRFATTIQWRYDGHDSLIDVGSGSGDVLMDFIRPMMPTNFQRIVCSDYSPRMITYANRHYGHIEKSEFRMLDIGKEKELPADLKEQFDHVMSFYVLMWVQNQRQGLKNIYQLLRTSGGDCLLVFLASHPIFDAFKFISQNRKWAKYMTDVDTFIPPLQHSLDPAKEYADIMSEVGFSNHNVEMEHKIFEYDNLEAFEASMKAVNPFLERIPLHLQDDHMNELVSAVSEIIGFRNNDYDRMSKYPIPYRLMTVYGRKHPEI